MCPAGSYCGSNGLTNPSGFCAAGYYCPAGQSEPTPGRQQVLKIKCIIKCMMIIIILDLKTKIMG